jgi:ADP-ribosylglycohydrolase
MNHVMTMPGEGTFRTDPGQLTDDSELALELAYGLLEYDTKLRFD